MRAPDLIIFDCDGVLVDSEPVSNAAMAENLARYGLRLTPTQSMQHFVGLSMPGVVEKAQAMGARLPEGWIAEVEAEMFEALTRGVGLVRGIPALLAALDQAGIACCVASNGSHEKMQVTLGQNGLWDRFASAMFSAQAMGVPKPAPDMFLAAAAQFGVAPQRCVVIEDSPTGARAARNAGMRCIGYAPQTTGAALRAEGAEVISDMGQVAALIGLSAQG